MSTKAELDFLQLPVDSRPYWRVIRGFRYTVVVRSLFEESESFGDFSYHKDAAERAEDLNTVLDVHES